jgi:hypothetical protein
MQNQNKYTVEFSSDEIHKLIECLANLRKDIVDDYNSSRGGRPPLEQPVFVAACELHHKLAHVVNPESSVSLDEYLDYGK